MSDRLLRQFRNWGLKHKLILAFALLIGFVVVASGLIIYTISKNRLEQTNRQLLLQNLKQTGALIDSKLDSYFLKSEIIFSNTHLQNFLRTQYGDLYSVYDAYQNQLSKVLEPVLMDMTYASTKGSELINVTIYTPNETLPKDSGILKDIKEIEGKTWVQELRQSKEKHQWQWVHEESGRKYISIHRLLTSFIDLKELGVLSIHIPEEVFVKLLQQNNEGSRSVLFLLGDSGDEIRSRSGAMLPEKDVALLRASESREQVEKRTIEGQEFLFASIESTATGWHLAALMPYSDVTQPLKPIGYAVAFILVVSLLLGLVLIVFIAHLTTRRLQLVIRKMNRVKSNWNEPLQLIAGRDEIGQLDATFNELIQALKITTEERVRLQVQKSSLQVELLQAQINPHLLYNTLATIQWKAKKADALEISDVSEALVRFFRHFLNHGDSRSTFGQELRLIGEYTKILRFTYNMAFEETIEFEEDIMAMGIPHLLLQPIVENAVVHGLRPKKAQGSLLIRGTKEGGRIIVEIIDDGVGMAPEQTDRINRSEQARPSYRGYGFLNVRKRILLGLGEEYGIQVESRPGAGTRVTLRLPAEYESSLE
ncbi:histidine kinase [Cohnella sp. LGH]|uniref:cache domain-containing sensor histidine kinase n=1 Tax=Cohnella sp. LGH TaxID=1619153 RepID=UPI001ADB908D|nr:sensor histidine kinase [Cohnella sp. LGH]QTH41086.1 histidine kinase [Cohnella sp. LGH]